MTGIFRNANANNTFLLFLYGLFLKFFLFRHPARALKLEDDGIVYKWLSVHLDAWHLSGLAVSALSFLLLFFQALMLNRIANQHHFFAKNTFLPGMNYLLLTSLVADFNYFSSVLLCATVIIWMLSYLLRLSHASNPKTMIFNAGMLAGILSMIYFPAVIFCLFMLIAVLIQRPFNLREIIISMMGAIAPYYFFYALMFLSDGGFQLPVFAKMTFYNPAWKPDTYGIIQLSVPLACLFAGMFYLQANFSRQVVHARKSWILIGLGLIFSVLMALFARGYTMYPWGICMVTLACLSSNVFYYPRRLWIPNLIQIFIIVFIFAREIAR